MQQNDAIQAAYPDVDFTINSMTKMIGAKMIKRTDSGMQIQLKHVFQKQREDGTCWNRRDMQSEKTLANVASIVKHIQKGGIVPAIEVKPREGGGVELIDGYCRTEAFRSLDASGVGEYWVSIVQFKGDELDELARIETSNHDGKLTPIEQLDLYVSIREELKRQGEKGTLQQIADRVDVSRQYVDQILQLEGLDGEARSLVGSGKVKVADAIKAVRSVKKTGGDVTQAIKKASAPKPLMPTKALMDDMYIGLGDLFDSMPKETKVAAQEFLKGDRKATDVVTIPVGELAKLLALQAEGHRQIEAQAERLAKKAEKDAQQEMAKDDLKQDDSQEEADNQLDDEPDLGQDPQQEESQTDDPDMSFLG